MLPYAKNSEIYEADSEFDYEQTKEIRWYDRILLNRPLKVFLGLSLAAILIPIILYTYVFSSNLSKAPADGYSTGSCLLSRGSRIVCGSGSELPGDCHSQCCFDERNKVCFHLFPSRFSYILNQPWNENIDLYPRQEETPYSNRYSLPKIRISIDEVSPTHVTITYYNPEEMTLVGSRIDKKHYNYEVLIPEFNINVQGDQGMLFNTIQGPLIAADDIWEVAFKLTNETMFGLGEIPLIGNTLKLIYSHKADSNFNPLIFALSNGSYHGLLIDVKAPTEVFVTEENQIHLRSLTKSGIKLHLFVGPEPEDVMRDVIKLIGFNNQFEYWMLGPHYCTESSGTLTEAYTELNTFITSASTASLPFDSHCGALPIVFENLCDTYIKDVVKRGSTLLTNWGKRFVPHISPYIEQLDNKTMVCNSNNENITEFSAFLLRKTPDDVYIGKINGQDVAYPDFNTTDFEFVDKLLGFYEIKPAGIVAENNWPLDETPKETNLTYNYLPYFSKTLENSFKNTPDWDVLRPNGDKLMYTHNEYGNQFAIALKYHTGAPVYTSSQYLDGEIILNAQNIDTTWTNLHKELIDIALSGISGHWLRISPVCGDTDTFDSEKQINLCIKWYMASAYFPMIKIHSKGTPRHPLAFTGNSRTFIDQALKKRMSLLPYINTVLQEGPLLRPMFYQYPHSEELKNIKSQFNVGDDILIVPNLLPYQKQVHFYMPPGTWFMFLDGLKLEGEEGDVVSLMTTDSDFITLVRGGSIITIQKDVRETAESTRYRSQLSIIITLASHRCITNASASGHLYISENMTLNFEADDIELKITATGDDFDAFCKNKLWSDKIKEIDVYGLENVMNNYDNFLRITREVDLCQLQTQKEIMINLII